MEVSEATKQRARRASCPYRVLDPKFRAHASRYALQCAAATASIFLILTLLDAFRQTVLVAALGASSFIAFAMPHVNSASPRYLVGGYLVGVAIGTTASLVAGWLVAAAPAPLQHGIPIAGAALATGLAIFAMVVTDTEHPPAAGLALGLVLNPWDLGTIAVVLAGIVAIASLKESCKDNMINLL